MNLLGTVESEFWVIKISKAMAKIRVVDYLGLEYENVWKDKKGKNHKILLKQF